MAEVIDLGSWAALGSAAVEEILVMTSELVANVISHTSDSPHLELEASPERVRVAVSDEDAKLPELAPLLPLRVGGNGLRIVDAFADDWGVVCHDDDGKTVWFDRRLTG